MERRMYHPSMMNAAVNKLLTTTTNPHHRAILENNRLHALLEVTGNWEQILTPQMTVDHPHYCASDGVHTHVFDGRDEVAAFYRSLADSGMSALFGPIDEQFMVSDWGLAAYGLWGFQLPGAMAAARGLDVDDPDAHYYMTEMVSMVWPYNDDAKLIGENILEDPGTRRFWKLDPAEVMTNEEAQAILAPMLEELTATAPSP